MSQASGTTLKDNLFLLLLLIARGGARSPLTMACAPLTLPCATLKYLNTRPYGAQPNIDSHLRNTYNCFEDVYSEEEGRVVPCPLLMTSNSWNGFPSFQRY